MLGDTSFQAHALTGASILCEKVLLPVSSLVLVAAKGTYKGVTNSLIPYVQDQWKPTRLAYDPTSKGASSQPSSTTQDRFQNNY